MSKILIQLKSFTYAARASRLCDMSGIKSKVIKTPKKLTKSGCGYSLQIDNNDSERVLEILKSNKIVIVEVNIIEENR